MDFDDDDTFVTAEEINNLDESVLHVDKPVKTRNASGENALYAVFKIKYI